MYVCAFIFATPIDGISVKTSLQWQACSVALLFAWINLVLYLRRFASYGIYVLMMRKICVTLIKVSKGCYGPICLVPVGSFFVVAVVVVVVDHVVVVVVVVVVVADADVVVIVVVVVVFSFCCCCCRYFCRLLLLSFLFSLLLLQNASIAVATMRLT